MKAQDIINRGVQEIKHPSDKSFSYSGKPDFKEEQPEIFQIGPKPGYSRPRTKQSVNNSYT